ncbi:MAG: hypothetical protein JSS95_01565 [Acidobacteria bacterium]|nr:hypothetical protein [Acidobacteriota bacterium]
MTYATSNIFVFVVLPLIFLAIWGYVFLYNRNVKKRIQQIAGPGRHLTSEEAGISAVTLENERAGKTGSIF